MPGTRYDRFLDIHLVAPKAHAAVNPDKAVGQGNHEYDFVHDVNRQLNDYRTKHVLPAGCREFTHVLGEHDGTPAAAVNLTSQLLEPLRYVACYVDLESLRPGERTIQELTDVIAWVSAQADGAGRPLLGKLRLNCHGSQRDGAGLSMGGRSLSPDDLVDALIRHGLAQRNRPDWDDPRDGKRAYGVSREAVAGGVVPAANFARWKPDAEVNACEKCRKAFTLLRRRHHCRRCGGIFCDACTTGRMILKNPLTEAGRATGTVPDCRVCDDCRSKGSDVYRFKDVKVGVKENKGLVQITLAMCLSARSPLEFGTLEAGFAPKSIAARLLKRLSKKGIHGIQVSGSNEVLTGYDEETFGIKYPGMSTTKRPQSGPVDDPFDGIWNGNDGWRGVLAVRDSLTIPVSVLGTNAEPGQHVPPIRANPRYRPIQDVRITPFLGGNALAFGSYARGSQEETLVKEVFDKWTFTSWRIEEQSEGPGNGRHNRIAGGIQERPVAAARWNDALGLLARQRHMMTMVLSAPQRNLRIHPDPQNRADWLCVSGFEERKFKDFKIIGVS